MIDAPEKGPRPDGGRGDPQTRAVRETVVDPPFAVVSIDEQGDIVELDDGAQEVLGLRRSEALGRPIAELIPHRLEADHGIHVRKAPLGESGQRFRREPALPGDVDQARVQQAIKRTDDSRARSDRDLSDERGADVESALQARLDHAEDMAQMGSWDWNVETDELRWSDNLYRIFGLEPDELTPTPGYVFERAHQADRERIERAVESARRDGLLQPLEYRIVRPDGEVRHLHMTHAVVKQADGGPRRIVGSLQDITDWHRAERAIAAQLAVAEGLAEWQGFERGTTGLLRNVAAALDCVAGVLWLPDGDVLAAQVIWRSGSTDFSELESVIRQLRLPRGVGLPGRVWETGEPITVLSLEDDPRFALEVIGEMRGALALPASHAEEVLAVLEFYSCETVGADVSDQLQRSLTGIGYELGEFLARRRGELRPRALTPRELEVLELAAQGCSGRQIAERLVVSPATVRRHFEHIYDKYGVSDRAAAVAKALREGLIE